MKEGKIGYRYLGTRSGKLRGHREKVKIERSRLVHIRLRGVPPFRRCPSGEWKKKSPEKINPKANKLNFLSIVAEISAQWLSRIITFSNMGQEEEFERCPRHMKLPVTQHRPSMNIKNENKINLNSFVWTLALAPALRRSSTPRSSCGKETSLQFLPLISLLQADGSFLFYFILVRF